MIAKFADNLEFHKAINLFIALQHAICNEDEDQADALREALEEPLTALSWEANEWLRGLSGDLDMVCDQEVFEPNKGSQEDLYRLILSAWRNIEEEPEPLLRLLRKEQFIVPYDLVAYGRARCYEFLGLTEVAPIFMKQAARLNPKQNAYKIFVLQSLKISNGPDNGFAEASQLSREIIENENATAEEVFMTSAMLLRKTNVLPEEVVRPICGWLRKSCQAIFSSSGEKAILPKKDVLFGQFVLGNINEKLNRTSAAKTCYSKVVQGAPAFDAGYLALGRLLFKTSEKAALPDFRKAVELKTADPLPYLVLARNAVVEKDYFTCISLSRAVIEIGGPQVQGQAYEFLAISEYFLHGMTELADHYFEQAVKSFPEDETIRQNQQIFADEKLRVIEEQKYNRFQLNKLPVSFSMTLTRTENNTKTFGLNDRISEFERRLTPDVFATSLSNHPNHSPVLSSMS